MFQIISSVCIFPHVVLKGCPRCTSWTHDAANCKNRRPTVCKEKVNGAPCGRPHLGMLHGSGSAYCNANAALNISVASSGAVVLLGVQEVRARGKEGELGAVLFFDSGSTLTLCRHGWAKAAGYVGRPVSLYMKVLSKGYESVDTVEYEVELVAKDGSVVKV